MGRGRAGGARERWHRNWLASTAHHHAGAMRQYECHARALHAADVCKQLGPICASMARSGPNARVAAMASGAAGAGQTEVRGASDAGGDTFYDDGYEDGLWEAAGAGGELKMGIFDELDAEDQDGIAQAGRAVATQSKDAKDADDSRTFAERAVTGSGEGGEGGEGGVSTPGLLGQPDVIPRAGLPANMMHQGGAEELGHSFADLGSWGMSQTLQCSTQPDSCSNGMDPAPSGTPQRLGASGVGAGSEATPTPHSIPAAAAATDIPTVGVQQHARRRRLLADVPANVDWRSRNKVTPIRDQGQCGEQGHAQRYRLALASEHGMCLQHHSMKLPACLYTHPNAQIQSAHTHT